MPVSSGEACGEGADLEAYPYFRAVDVTIEFIQRSAPPEVRIPEIGQKRRESPGKVDPNKALKDIAGLREGIVDVLIEIIAPAHPSKGPPKIKIDFKKAIEGGGEGASKGLADVAFEANTQRSFDQQLKRPSRKSRRSSKACARRPNRCSWTTRPGRSTRSFTRCCRRLKSRRRTPLRKPTPAWSASRNRSR